MRRLVHSPALSVAPGDNGSVRFPPWNTGAMDMPALDAVAAKVRAWYGDYLKTFTSLAAGERIDLEALLDYFGVPLVIVTDDRFLALQTPDAVLSTATTLIEQLRQAN